MILYSPILTFVIILLLPSLLTLITLLVHRVRASRAAQRDRAPEDIVRNLPWRVWNGKKWEKDPASKDLVPAANELDVEQGPSHVHTPSEHPPWFSTQSECAICLEDFVIGDKVRVLPCEHVFHVEEIDDWLINRKKLVRNIYHAFRVGLTLFLVPSLQSRCDTGAADVL